MLKFFGILTAIIIAAAILSPGDDNEGGTTTAPAGDKEQAQDAAQETEQQKSPGIGDEAVDGDFTFVVSADSEAAVYLEDSQSLLEEINPGNSVTGTVVFDIPADATPASLELHDSMLSGGVTVAVGK